MKAILSEALLAFTDHHIAVRSITPSDNISCFTMTAFVITLLIRTIKFLAVHYRLPITNF